MAIDVDLELKMKMSGREFRVLLLDKFRLGGKAVEATSNICSTMDKDALFIRTTQQYYSGNTSARFSHNLEIWSLDTT